MMDEEERRRGEERRGGRADCQLGAALYTPLSLPQQHTHSFFSRALERGPLPDHTSKGPTARNLTIVLRRRDAHYLYPGGVAPASKTVGYP